MKISKQRIKEIIKEELALVEAEEQQDAQSKQELALKFKELSKLVPKAQGIDTVEAKLINAIIKKVIEASNNDNAKSELVHALKKLGVEL
tara:strand:- start:642 stop:911 length:270 start_codon:yes stop_codon:yes gene_type:complete